MVQVLKVFELYRGNEYTFAVADFCRMLLTHNHEIFLPILARTTGPPGPFPSTVDPEYLLRSLIRSNGNNVLSPFLFNYIPRERDLARSHSTLVRGSKHSFSSSPLNVDIKLDMREGQAPLVDSIDSVLTPPVTRQLYSGCFYTAYGSPSPPLLRPPDPRVVYRAVSPGLLTTTSTTGLDARVSGQ